MTNGVMPDYCDENDENYNNKGLCNMWETSGVKPKVKYDTAKPANT